VALREEHRMKVFEKMVLKRIFGRKRDEMTGGWRQLHNEELRNLYSSSNVIRMIKSRIMSWTGPVSRMRETRNTYRVFVGIPDGKRPPGRRRHRWEDNIKRYLGEIGGAMYTGFIWLRIGTSVGLLLIW
jgi:hypothetical protein